MTLTMQARLRGMVLLGVITTALLIYNIPVDSNPSQTSQLIHQRGLRKVLTDVKHKEPSIVREPQTRKLSPNNGLLSTKSQSFSVVFMSIHRNLTLQDNSIIDNNHLSDFRESVPSRSRDEHVLTIKKHNTLRYCDDECKKFKSLLGAWNPNRPKAAFYYLTKLSRLSLLKDSLASVDLYFNSRFQYPIIVFHEDDLIHYRDTIRNMTKSQVFFQQISFKIPDFLEKPIARDIPCYSELTYRHMCRFHAKTIYEEMIMQELQYYWRLDDDSLLTSPVDYNVFEYMEANSIQYGYLWRHWDAYSCVEGLWDYTAMFIKKHNITTEFFDEWKNAYLYYNNFEISSTKMWFSLNYKSYIDYIDRLGGIFYNRWGDAPIHGIAVAMFIPKNQTHLFHDIGYQHGWYKHEAITETVGFHNRTHIDAQDTNIDAQDANIDVHGDTIDSQDV